MALADLAIMGAVGWGASELLNDWMANEGKSKPKKIKPKPGSKPKSCPSGTLPIDQYPGLDKDDIHDIKDGVGAGPRDWTGISPDGDVITGDHTGESVNNGPFKDYLP